MAGDNCNAIKNAFTALSIITRTFVRASSEPERTFQNTKLGGTTIHTDEGIASVDSKGNIGASSAITAEAAGIGPIMPENIGFIFSSALKLVAEFGEDAKNHVDSAFLEKIMKESVKGFLEHDLKATIVGELCEVMKGPIIPVNHKGGKKKKNTEKVSPSKDEFTRAVIRLISALRGTVTKLLDVVLTGDAVAHQEVNHLFELMSRQAWTEAVRHRYEWFDEAYVFLQPGMRGLADLRRHAIRIFKDSLINLRWKDSLCYEKCVCPKNGSSKASCSKSDKEAKSRDCSEESGCACHLQCYTFNADGIPAEGQLLGRNRLKDWDININDVHAKSYDKYDKYDKDRTSMVDDPEADHPKDDHAKNDHAENDHAKDDHDEDDHPEVEKSTVESLEAHEHLWELPTCASTQVALENSLPCTCGDWRSSETFEFMNKLGIGFFQEGHNSSVARHFFMNDCPKVR